MKGIVTCILLHISSSWLELTANPKFTHNLEVVTLTQEEKKLPWNCSKIDFINGDKTFMVHYNNSW